MKRTDLKNTSKRCVALLVLAAGIVSTAVYAQTTRNVWQGVFTKEQATHGQAVYTAHCVACHGASLNGGDVAPPIAGPTFLGSWNSTTAADLFQRIYTTMPQDNPGSLSRADTADIEAYIFQVNGFPAGDAALPPSDPALANIAVTASKP